MTKILLTGGSGLLGQHLKIEADRPSHEELDITHYLRHEHRFPKQEVKVFEDEKPFDLIIHCAAYTDVQQAEIDRQKCFDVNVQGTLNLLLAFPTIPFVYISTEYAHNPLNFYSLTKSMAEQLVTTHPNYLIIRTLFKPNPWPYEKAFKDQWTSGDYVDFIAPKIEKEILEWDRKSKLIYVGTGRKTMYQLAKRTRPNVIPNSIKEMKVPIPSDYQ